MNLTDDLKKIVPNHKYIDKIASLSPNYKKRGTMQLNTSSSQFDLESKTMGSTFCAARGSSHSKVS